MLQRAVGVRPVPLRQAPQHLSWQSAAVLSRHAAGAARAWRSLATPVHTNEQDVPLLSDARHDGQHAYSLDGNFQNWIASDNIHEVVANLATKQRQAAAAQLRHKAMAADVLDTICGSLLGYYNAEPELFQQYIAGTEEWRDAILLLTSHATSLFSHAHTQPAASDRHVADATAVSGFEQATAQRSKDMALERVLVLIAELFQLAHAVSTDSARTSSADSAGSTSTVGGQLVADSIMSAQQQQQQQQQLVTAVTAWLSSPQSVLAATDHSKRDSMLGVRVASVLQAYTTILATAVNNQASHSAICSAEATQLVDKVCDALSDTLADVAAYQPASPQHLAEVMEALACTKRRSASVARVAEAIAHELYRQISNRASTNVPLYPQHIVKMLQAYAQLQIKDVAVFRMLDATAGYIVKCIRQRNDAAFKEPHHVADMLHAYADMGHDSVVIPELVATTARSLAADIADMHVRIDMDLSRQGTWHTDSAAQQPQQQSHQPQQQQPPQLQQLQQQQQHLHQPQQMRQHQQPSQQQQEQPITNQQSGIGNDAVDSPSALLTARGQAAWQAELPGHTVCHLIDGYHRLQLYPGQVLMSTLMVAVSAQLDTLSPTHAARILQVLSEQGHYPGPSICTGLLNTIHQRWKEGLAGAMQLAAGLIAAAALNHPTSDSYIEDTCYACLYQEQGDTSHHAGQYLSSTLQPDVACQVLFALVVQQQVTIRQLGMACMALREAASKTRKLPSQQLACVAAAALLLGEEGEEMMDEVLPADIATDSRAALQQLLDSWQNLWRSSSANELHAVLQQEVHAQDGSQRHWSLLHQGDAAVQALPDAMSSLPILCHHDSTCVEHIAVEPLLACDLAINASTHTLGMAVFRRTVLQQLWDNNSPNQAVLQALPCEGIPPAIAPGRRLLLQVSWPYIQQSGSPTMQATYVWRLVHAAAPHVQ